MANTMNDIRKACGFPVPKLKDYSGIALARTKGVRAALASYSEAKPTDAGDVVADLLADLMHEFGSIHIKQEFDRAARNHFAEFSRARNAIR